MSAPDAASPAVVVDHVTKRFRVPQEQRNTLKVAMLRNFNGVMIHPGLGELMKPAALTNINRDATKSGTAIWTTDEVTKLLANYGLPPESPLSVLCVEVLPRITNLRDHVSALNKPNVQQNLRSVLNGSGLTQAMVDRSVAAERPARPRSRRCDGRVRCRPASRSRSRWMSRGR